LNIEQFSQRKFNKIKTETLEKLGQALDVFGKPLMSEISWK
jgi:DNA-binding Xre family transcriptional regulator